MRVTHAQMGAQRIVVISDESGAVMAEELTPAERDVCRLVEKGLSNGAIAARRSSSPRTVANQLQSIYRKLSVSGRRELIATLSIRYGASPTAQG